MLGFLFGPRPYRKPAELAKAMVAALQALPGVARVETSPEDQFQLKVFFAGHSGSSDINLHNAAAHILGQGLTRAEQDDDIRRFSASLIATQTEIPLIIGNLMITVRHYAYIQAMIGAWEGHPDRDKACRPLNEDLCAVIMQDLGDSYRTTTPGMFEKAGISVADGLREAAANFDRLARTRVVERFAEGVWLVHLAGEELMSISLLAFPDHLDAIQREIGLDEALFAAPTRNGILIGAPERRDILRTYILRSQNEGHLQSACIFGRAVGQEGLGYIEHYDGTGFVTATQSTSVPN